MQEKYIVPALERGLTILEFISNFPDGASAGDMKSLNLPPATLYRLLNTLEECGYITRQGADSYRLSRKLLSIGYQAADENGLIMASHAVMRELRDETGESVMIAVLYGNEGIVLDEVPSGRAVKFSVKIGHHFPLHSAAPAKAILAYLTEHEQQKILNSINYTIFTPNTIANAAVLKNELDIVKKQGFAFDRGEELLELRCVAAPIFDFRKTPVGAISIGGPSSRLNDENLIRCAPIVKAAAAKITDIFNF